MPLPNRLKTILSSDLPYTPSQLNFGSSSQEKFNADRKRNLGLHQALGHLTDWGERFWKSYNESSEPTLAHYRDLLISKAIEVMCYNAQFTDSSQDRLTTHAAKVWMKYDHRQLWSYIPPVASEVETDYRFAGLLGTLAYYFTHTDIKEKDLIQSIEACLMNLWTLCGAIDYTLTPGQRLLKLIELMLPSKEIVSEITSTLQHTLTTEDSRYKSARALLYRNLIGAADFKELRSKLLVGEYNSCYLEVLDRLANDDLISKNLAQSLKDTENKVKSLIKPAGMPLIFLAFVVESYLEVIKGIEKLSPEIKSVSMSDFTTKESYRLMRNKIFTTLSLALDSLEALNYFKTLTSVKQTTEDIRSFLGSNLDVASFEVSSELSRYRIDTVLSDLD
jgi:hypothetical protein